MREAYIEVSLLLGVLSVVVGTTPYLRNPSVFLMCASAGLMVIAGMACRDADITGGKLVAVLVIDFFIAGMNTLVVGALWWMHRQMSEVSTENCDGTEGS